MNPTRPNYFRFQLTQAQIRHCFLRLSLSLSELHRIRKMSTMSLLRAAAKSHRLIRTSYQNQGLSLLLRDSPMRFSTEAADHQPSSRDNSSVDSFLRPPTKGSHQLLQNLSNLAIYLKFPEFFWIRVLGFVCLLLFFFSHFICSCS